MSTQDTHKATKQIDGTSSPLVKSGGATCLTLMIAATRLGRSLESRGMPNVLTACSDIDQLSLQHPRLKSFPCLPRCSSTEDRSLLFISTNRSPSEAPTEGSTLLPGAKLC
ncbi:hypothetical protein EVAR_81445_1 [Eumeta japonica]|uniref:Uncharacterized protein n=1 Tax=Eumeta variegata TaxID=151549 RepID=A0A4C1W1S8_EUMVA|nr:hypothetical protein EVAR_81445_1 [Eumeta japonica]